jgi:hypothetical protein
MTSPRNAIEIALRHRLRVNAIDALRLVAVS